MYQHTRHREGDPAPSVFALRKDLLDHFLTDLNTGRRLCLFTRTPQLPFTPPASRRPVAAEGAGVLSIPAIHCRFFVIQARHST